MEVLSEQQCQLLLGTKDIGRIAFSVGGVPEIFPVNYAADRSTVVFRTAEGTRLQRAVIAASCIRGRRLGPGDGDWMERCGQGCGSGDHQRDRPIRNRVARPPGRSAGARHTRVLDRDLPVRDHRSPLRPRLAGADRSAGGTCLKAGCAHRLQWSLQRARSED